MQVFSTDEDHVLALQVIHSTNKVVLKVKDGADTDSPYIWSAEIQRNQWPNPPPVIVTQSNSMQIQVHTTDY